MEGRYDEILTRGDYPSRRLNLMKGDLWIQDPRRAPHEMPKGILRSLGRIGALFGTGA